MKLIHLKRAVLWVGILIYTLAKFWIKNPKDSVAILNFIIEKIVASPRFFSRNVLVERKSQEFKENLLQTVKLYRKFGKSFNVNDPISYKRLEKILSNKTQILYFLVKKLKPEIVVETGVATGESTGYMLQGIKDNGFGKLYSIDLPFQWYLYGDHKLHLDSLPAGKMPGYLIPKQLKKNWYLILGDTHNKLPPLLSNLGTIDIFFHDSEHTDKTMLFEYNQSWPYIKQDGLLISDDISYSKAFDQFSKEKKLKKIIFKDLGVIIKK